MYSKARVIVHQSYGGFDVIAEIQVKLGQDLMVKLSEEVDAAIERIAAQGLRPIQEIKK